MKILFISAEVAPFAKVGGLADVAGGLPKSLVASGKDCRVIMPAYAMVLNDPRWAIETVIKSFNVELRPGYVKKATLFKIDHEGVTNYLIGTNEWFDQAVDSESMYVPGGDHHAFFAAAIFAAMEKLGWIPDVLHANDWHTGFVPVWLREKAGKKWQDTASVFTIHNLAYQGEFGLEALDWLGLSHDLFNHHQVEAWGRVNFLKAGLAFADQISTVSPTYATQIQTQEYGCALEGMMQYLSANHRLTGILNGIDTDVFDPANDGDLPHWFSHTNPEGKDVCRKELLREVKMEPIEGAMLVGMVSRLSSQKGFDLVLAAAPELFKLPIQLVIQGLGDPHLVAGFRQLEAEYPKHIRLMNVFDAPLAQRVYGGTDAFLMPSSFEPCGLGQLIAMRYGSVPIVRSTGGLTDTIFDGENGFSFAQRSIDELVNSVSIAKLTFDQPTAWKKIQHAGMTADHGWAHRASAYNDLYLSALKSRSGKQMV
jgi:starch synthase